MRLAGRSDRTGCLDLAAALLGPREQGTAHAAPAPPGERPDFGAVNDLSGRSMAGRDPREPGALPIYERDPHVPFRVVVAVRRHVQPE